MLKRDNTVLFVTALLLALVMPLEASSRQKRLVLHSTMDLAQEIMKLRAEMTTLNNTYKTEMAALNNTYQNDVQNLKSTIDNLNNTHRQEIESLKLSHAADLTSFMSKMTDTFKKHGSTYIRWGRQTCAGGNGTRLIYKGYMAGSSYGEAGSGANQLCLPEDPTWGKYDDGNQDGNRAYIYGTEYDEVNTNIFGKPVFNEDVPCAVCQVPGTSLMIPARTMCYPGWTLEYTGYLMSSWHGRTRPANYVCVDGDPEFVIRGAADKNGHLLCLVEGICGSLVCPPYFNYRELACSVCSRAD